MANPKHKDIAPIQSANTLCLYNKPENKDVIINDTPKLMDTNIPIKYKAII